MGNYIKSSRNEQLRVASFRGNYDDVVRLINAGADINYADIDGQSPLMKSVMGTNIEICQYLLSKGANINQTDNCGETALHFACMGGTERLYIAKLLFERGADPNIKNKSGFAPIYYTTRSSYSKEELALISRINPVLHPYIIPREYRRKMQQKDDG